MRVYELLSQEKQDSRQFGYSKSAEKGYVWSLSSVFLSEEQICVLQKDSLELVLRQR